jgi:D-alanyl-D-alanine carboxypeptidase
VAAAERDGQTHIAVVLKSQEKAVWQDARKLLDYGFQNVTSS